MLARKTPSSIGRAVLRGIPQFKLYLCNGVGYSQKRVVNPARTDQGVGQCPRFPTQDLEAHNLLDRTLIVIGTEFGRPPGFGNEGGRGHKAQTFSIVLAAEGLNHKGVIGETDELVELLSKLAINLYEFDYVEC